MPALGFKVDISTCEEFFAKLGDPRRVKKVTRKALRKGAAIIRDGVATEAPTRDDSPSGTALPVGAMKADVIVRSATEDGKEVAYVQQGKYTDHVAAWVTFGHQMVRGGRLSTSGKGKGKRVKVGATRTTVTRPNRFYERGANKTLAAAQVAIEESLGADLIDPNAQAADTGNERIA